MFRIPLKADITIKRKRGKTPDGHPFTCNVEDTPAQACVGGDKGALADPSVFPEEGAPDFPPKEGEGDSRDHPGTPFLEKESRVEVMGPRTSQISLSLEISVCTLIRFMW